MDIKDIFTAEPKSISQLLGQSGIGFYIPAYQREYTWDKSKVHKLLNDVLLGLEMLVEKDDATTFLGTIIVINDTRYETVHPIVRQDLPGAVKLVIDGQQRLSTLSIILATLENTLNKHIKKLSHNNEVDSWLRKECIKLTKSLNKTYSIDQDYSEDDEIYQYYPKIIRAFLDQWSRSKKTAQYGSPIAKFLHQAIRANKSGEELKEFELEDELKTISTYSILRSNVNDVKKYLNKIENGGDSDMEFPLLSDMSRSENFQETLLNNSIPDFVTENLRQEDPSTHDKRNRRIFRLIVFANYLLKRTAVTVVSTKNEDYAFDIFEALNTTGEPLTAFETFKPDVIKAEGYGDYEHSESRDYVEKIESYFKAYDNPDKKQTASSKLLIPFRLFQSGEKLSTKLSEQRIYLKKQFKELKALEEQRDFIRELEASTHFLKNAWSDDFKKKPSLGIDGLNLDDDSILCLDLLRHSKHNITLGLLFRFYSKLRKSPEESRLDALLEFQQVIKAITAFFILWRTSRTTTDSIDSYYRQILLNGLTIEGLSINAFAGLKSEDSTISSEKLKSFFKNILSRKGNVSSKEEWIKKFNQIPIYDISRPITKFLLLLAHHNMIPSSDKNGLNKIGREGVFEIFDYQNWKLNELTIEHIAPRNPARPIVGWDNAIYDEINSTDTLGNLLLLPLAENIAVGNSSWESKRNLYSLMCSKTPSDLEILLNELKEGGFDVSAKVTETIKSGKCLHYVEAISQKDDNFTFEFIQERTNNLGSVIWDRISPWLFDIEM